MRKKIKTIKLAKIRRHIREAIKWYVIDDGMPKSWVTENWRYTRNSEFFKQYWRYLCE